MAKIMWNGQEYHGSRFEIRNGSLYVDGLPMSEFTERAVRIDGDGNCIITAENVVFREEIKNCNITALKVVINAPAIDCNIDATQIFYNVCQHEKEKKKSKKKNWWFKSWFQS